jgi:lysozyme family protein
MSEDEGYDIYYSSYWLPHCPALANGLDLCYFDSAVNEGGTQATRILQVAIGVGADGVWGPQTDAAVKGISDVTSVINEYTARREAVYRATRGFQYFGTDWLRRASEIGAEALKMAASPVVPAPQGATPTPGLWSRLSGALWPHK